MTFRHWLPENALVGPAGKATLLQPVVEWASHWFAHMHAAISDVCLDDHSEAAPAADFEIRGIFANIEMHPIGKRQLLETLLNADLGKQRPSGSDTSILDAVAAEVARDLVRRIEALFSEANDGNGGTRLRYALSIGGKAVLNIVVAASAITPLFKAQLNAPRLPPRDLIRRTAALRHTHVTTRAILGEAELSLGDIVGLAIGDVLVLDRSLTEKVELRLADSVASIARGHLCRNGDHISIQL